jgi:hypothetical protein
MKLKVNFYEYLVASRRFCLRNKSVIVSLPLVGRSSESSVYPRIPYESLKTLVSSFIASRSSYEV